jgi:cobalt-zinc-cadmium efflux system outer membrane protein
VLFLSGAAGLVPLAAAAVETGSQPLTLSRVLARVLRDSPELAVYPYRLRAAEADALQASLRPNPELSLEVENIAGDNEFSRTDSAEFTLALSQVIELGGKRQYRQSLARIGGELAQRDYELARLDVLARAAGVFIDVAQAQRLLELAEQAANWAESAEKAAAARLQAGSASRVELSQARIEAYRSQLTITKLQNHLDSARLQLAGQWGAEQVEFTEVRADLFSLAVVPAFAELRIRLDRSPQLQRFLTLDRLRQAELDLAIARGRQNVSVGLGVRHFEATGDQALTLQFSMPLGVSDHNQGGIAAAREQLKLLDSERTVSRIALFNELHRLYRQMEQARRGVDVLRGQALPEAERALKQVEHGYRTGRFSYLELVEVRRQRLAVERDAIDAAVDFHRALLILEQLTGESLTEAPRSIVLQSQAAPFTKQDSQP